MINNKINFLKKIHFQIKNPPVIIMANEESRSFTSEIIGKFLNTSERKAPVFEITSQKSKDINFLIKHSSLPILIVDDAKEKERIAEIRSLIKKIPKKGYLVLNFDDETIRELKKEKSVNQLTFGFQEGADFRATDVKVNGGTNFKVGYRGNIVPFWLKDISGEERIYSVLSGAAVGAIFGLNLIEVSQSLKDY